MAEVYLLSRNERQHDEGLSHEGHFVSWNTFTNGDGLSYEEGNVSQVKPQYGEGHAFI